MKKWEKYDSPAREETHILYFSHHNGEPEKIVCLFRDAEGDWRTTSDLLNTFWTWLTSGATDTHDAKLLVEEMVSEHYADEAKYYQEILEEFRK